MSIAGIAASSIFQALHLLPSHSKAQSFEKQFQQLGQDLQSGNLAQAQTDFAAPQPNGVHAASNSITQTAGNSLLSAFNQLSSDLKAGNLTAA